MYKVNYVNKALLKILYLSNIFKAPAFYGHHRISARSAKWHEMATNQQYIACPYFTNMKGKLSPASEPGREVKIWHHAGTFSFIILKRKVLKCIIPSFSFKAALMLRLKLKCLTFQVIDILWRIRYTSNPIHHTALLWRWNGASDEDTDVLPKRIEY